MKLKKPVEAKVKKIVGNMTNEEKEEKLKTIKELQEDFYQISKQVQSNEFHEEEKGRSGANSGIKQIRANNGKYK